MQYQMSLQLRRLHACNHHVRVFITHQKYRKRQHSDVGMPLKFLDFIERESSVSPYYKKSSKKNIKNIYMTKRFFYNT